MVISGTGFDASVTEWFYGSQQIGTGSSVNISADSEEFSLLGLHYITALVFSGSIEYTVHISITVVE